MPPFARRRTAMVVLNRSKKRRLDEDETLADRSDIVSLLHSKDGAVMGVLSRSKKRRLEEEDEPLPLPDRISSLPDDILGDIVSLLPTKDGACTQVLSSRWRHVWRSAPLNLELRHGPAGRGIYASDISRILSAHLGPGRRFVLPRRYVEVDHPTAATLVGWLSSPALDNLEELEFRHVSVPPIPLPASVHRFSSTLRVATFSGCSFFPVDGNNAGRALRLPVLQQMTISNVDMLESSLHAVLAACPVLQSLLLIGNYVSSRLRIVSHSLRSIGLHSSWRSHSVALVIEDAPCLERLQYFGGMQVDISVISAPRLVTLANLFDHNCPRLRSGRTSFQGSPLARMTAMLPSVKVLSLSNVKLCADAAFNLVRCFPHLERLYIKAKGVWMEHLWYHENQKLIGTNDIRMRKIVLVNYKGSKSHIDFVKFFLSNARVLESLRLELGDENASNMWIARQRKLLDIKKRASRGARVTFLPPNNILIGQPDLPSAAHVHDLSTDPFQRFHDKV